MERPYVEKHRFGRVGRIPTPTPFAVGDVNCYALLPSAGSEELILVDTGVRSPRAWDALRSGLKEFGFRVEDVGHLLLTHAHPDHYGQARRIRDVSGCRVYIHEDARESFARYESFSPDRMKRVSYHYARWGVPKELHLSRTAPEGVEALVESIEPDRYLRDGETLGFGELEIDVLHTPGHCPEEVVYWIAEEGTLLSGDHLLPDITPVALLDVPATPETPRVPTLVQFLESLQKVEHLPVERAFPSHGDVIWNHRELIDSYRLHHEKRKLQIARQLEHGELSPGEIGQRMFRHFWRQQVHLVLSEVLGHLDVLERDGYVESFERDGVVRYRLISLPPPT